MLSLILRKNTMRFVISLLIFTSYCFTLEAQVYSKADNVQPDNRLKNVFSQTYLERLSADNPLLISKWNFYLDNSYFISDFPKGKNDDNSIKVIEVEDINNINIKQLEKDLGIGPDYNRQMIYRIKDTNKLLIYYAGKKFYELFNKYRTNS